MNESAPHTDEMEEFEKEQRRPVVDMLKRSIPNFTEWGNEVLTVPSPEEALKKMSDFPEGVHVLPDDLQDAWQVNPTGQRSGIYFNNPANGRQFEVMYSIVESDLPGQQFTKEEARKKAKAVSTQVAWSVDRFVK